VNVILGATGVGKTLMAVQQAIAFAQTQFEREIRGEEPAMGVVISYEDDIKSLQIRAMCRAANIMKNRLESMTEFTDLSTASTMQPYELKMEKHIARDESFIRLGEQERLATAKIWLNKYFKPIDFSTYSTSIGGNGGIAEIRPILEMLQEQNNMRVGYLWVDWAGMSVRRKLRYQGRNIDGGILSAELGGYVQEINEAVAAPLGIPVTVLHQLRGQANKRSPVVVPDHADAEWCASFAVNAWFVLTIGTKDRESNACLVAGTKTRRGQGHPAVLCRINGAFGEIVPAGDDLTIDSISKKIVLRSDIARAGGSGRAGGAVHGYQLENDDPDISQGM
jgi:hypothetical protein